MKRVLFVADHLPDGETPDSPLLLLFSRYFCEQGYQVLVSQLFTDLPVWGHRLSKNGFWYRVVPNIHKSKFFNSRFFSVFRKYLLQNYYRSIVKKRRVNKIVVFAYPRRQAIEKLAALRNRYTHIIYDPFFCSPIVTNEVGAKTAALCEIEGKAISQAEKYFVPIYFRDEYSAAFKTVLYYPFPLSFSAEEVNRALASSQKRFTLAYFGSLYAGNRDCLMLDSFCRKYNLVCDVFTHQMPIREQFKSFRFHAPLSGAELLQAMANSEFLVILDNNSPYTSFFPSKVIQYVSVGKPILVFGHNHSGKTAHFLADYNDYLYITEETDDNLIRRFLAKERNDSMDPSRKRANKRDFSSPSPLDICGKLFE